MNISESVAERLRELLAVRVELAEAKIEAEMALKDHDNEIRVFMIMNGVKDRFKDPELGYGMKISEGENQYIAKDLVIETLAGMEWNPDQIKWFIKEVTKRTPYDYVDCRKLSKEDMENESRRQS